MSKQDKPVRRSALIGPWGVGSVVPFPDDGSMMIAGLDAWDYEHPEDFVIKDERLQKRLNVRELRLPPDFREVNEDSRNSKIRIPAVRFPTWYYCSFCGTMQKATWYSQHPTCSCYQWKNGRVCNPDRRAKKLIPERFIVICPNGHIDDFPVAEWLHHGSGHEYRPIEKGGTCVIRRSTGGASASINGVVYECTCGAKKSLRGATVKGALSKIGIRCNGSSPWLGEEKNEDNPCACPPEELRVVLSGATNVWFADTRSSIYIPVDNVETSRKIIQILDRHYDVLYSSRVNGEWNKDIIKHIATISNVNFEDLYAAIIEREQNSVDILGVNEEISEDEYRLAEYNVLRKDSGSDKQDFFSRNLSISNYNPIISNFFKSISLVYKLRETRAIVGFSRVTPSNLPLNESKKTLWRKEQDWLPAIQVNGEGIFFGFNKEALEEWANSPEVMERIRPLQESYKDSFFGGNADGKLRPEFVLIHTFAHLIINQVSFECGYGSSSIRERIYCEKTSDKYGMTGVLIYTASGDSEGSLGGLVRQGEPGKLEDIIINAIKNAAWCSADPVCIQSLGQGPESLNLAACHNCALLPETCCECGNRLLDRGLVVGDLIKKNTGFLAELRNG